MQPAPITIYGIANCDSVKKARLWFEQNNVAVSFHDFKKQGLAAPLLAAWLEKIDWNVLLNRKGTTWRRLDASVQAQTNDAPGAQALMLAHPSLVKRPVVVLNLGQDIVVGVNPQAWQDVLKR